MRAPQGLTDSTASARRRRASGPSVAGDQDDAQRVGIVVGRVGGALDARREACARATRGERAMSTVSPVAVAQLDAPDVERTLQRLLAPGALRDELDATRREALQPAGRRRSAAPGERPSLPRTRRACSPPVTAAGRRRRARLSSGNEVDVGRRRELGLLAVRDAVGVVVVAVGATRCRRGASVARSRRAPASRRTARRRAPASAARRPEPYSSQPHWIHRRSLGRGVAVRGPGLTTLQRRRRSPRSRADERSPGHVPEHPRGRRARRRSPAPRASAARSPPDGGDASQSAAAARPRSSSRLPVAAASASAARRSSRPWSRAR